MGSPSEDVASVDTEENGKVCFRVKYLGCATFTLRKKRLPKGIASMQRPLLEVYAGARKKGETHRGSHLFAMDQRLDVLEYGLVLAQGDTLCKQSMPTGEDGLVLIKVLTPLSNAVLWAAVRFQARALRKRVLGAAFVPLACCDAVFDQDGYLRLDAKHRFLASLSHPSVFSVVFRRVTDPRSFECHAFACGSAAEALALGSALSLVRERCEMPAGIVRPPLAWQQPPQMASADESRRRTGVNPRRRRTFSKPPRSKHVPDSDESNSYASVHKFTARPQRNLFVRRRRGGGSDSSSCPKEMVMERRATPIGRSEEADFHGWPSGSAPSSSVSFFSPSDESCSVDYRDRQAPSTKSSVRRDVWTMTENGVTEQEKTIDLSSESSRRSSLSGGVQPEEQWTPLTGSSAPVKYTYFGYETFRAPTWTHRSASDDELAANTGMVTAKNIWRPASGNLMPNTSTKRGNAIVGNGTGRITINVPFSKKRSQHAHRRPGGGRSSVASTQTDASSCSATVLLPLRGVRSFRSDRHVGDWSTLSQSTSDEASMLQTPSRKPRPCESSFSSSSDSNRRGPRPSSQQKPHKMLRWSSEDRLPRRNGYAFFWSLKRLSVQSFTKAKHKTGKLFSSVRTKLMGSRKGPESSEDSAYDTSEVCLSPSGRTTCGRSCCTDELPVKRPTSKGVKAHRQQSWSFHDLRTLEDRSPENKHRTMPLESHRPVVVLRKLADKHPSSKRRTTRRRTKKMVSSASDSGVEEYPSDRCGSDRTDSNRRVTRVQVHHGMNEETFHRWSHTNLQEELGYIP